MAETETVAREAAPKVAPRVVDGVEYPAVGTYVLDPAHTRLGFSVRHMAVAKVRGSFTRFSGTVQIAERPEDSSVSVTIDPDSVDTRDETRDNHLRSSDFFDVEHHPEWRFESVSVRTVEPGRFEVDGNLTIRGVTRLVTLDLELEGVVTDPWGNHRVGFSARTSIDRDDFGVSFGAVMETGGLVVGKKVDIEIEAEATLQS
ncbi:MAG TPA: YceI family protein [Acidimicrobiales bacterium]|nr:YceI family protein [Acidimicrobiales bacterium]